MSEDYPKCKYCGRPIMWIGKRPYEAEIPPERQNDPDYRMKAMRKPIPHHCSEYYAQAPKNDL